MLSSSTEGFSIATIEAMACELPVIATRCGGPEEIIRHEEDGILVDVGDSKQLAAAVQRVCEDQTFGRRLAQQARATVLSRFSTDNMLSSYQRIYDQL